MQTMNSLAVSLKVICFTQISAVLLNWDNNACKNYIDYPTRFINKNCYNNPDIDDNITTIVERHNYDVEIYELTTDDNYILTLFRIPSKKPQAQPVYLQHGLSGDSSAYLVNGKKSLAFVLADLGYDVWLGNLRGTPYSQQHLNLSVEDPNYWNFNLDTLTTMDLRASLQHVAKKTGKAGSIIYIGHSMGGTLAFMFSSKYSKEASALLRGIVLFAPVVYTKGVRVLDNIKPLIHFLQFFHIWGLAYHTMLTHKILTGICTLLPLVCRGVLNAIVGPSRQYSPEILLLIIRTAPFGTALSAILHYLQIHGSGRFEHFDYGKFDNLQKYGSVVPPRYDLEKITLPVYTFYGKQDPFYTETNFDRLMEEVGSDRKFASDIPPSNSSFAFNHDDFIFSEHIEETLYRHLIPILTNELTPV